MLPDRPDFSRVDESFAWATSRDSRAQGELRADICLLDELLRATIRRLAGTEAFAAQRRTRADGGTLSCRLKTETGLRRGLGTRLVERDTHDKKGDTRLSERAKRVGHPDHCRNVVNSNCPNAMWARGTSVLKVLPAPGPRLLAFSICSRVTLYAEMIGIVSQKS
jgi:hypothetical protein